MNVVRVWKGIEKYQKLTKKGYPGPRCKPDVHFGHNQAILYGRGVALSCGSLRDHESVHRDKQDVLG